MVDDESGFWYPSRNDVLAIHEDIIQEDPEGTPGVEDPERIEYALDRIRHGHFGAVPETVHEKAFQLLRLLAANHWFVDGNKRTALNTTEMFYLFNGYEFDYGEDVRAMLKLFSVREGLIDRDVGTEYVAEQARRIENLSQSERFDRILRREEFRMGAIDRRVRDLLESTTFDDETDHND